MEILIIRYEMCFSKGLGRHSLNLNSFLKLPSTGYRWDFPFTLIKKAYFIMKTCFITQLSCKNNKGRMFYFVLLLTTFDKFIFFLISSFISFFFPTEVLIRMMLPLQICPFLKHKLYILM